MVVFYLTVQGITKEALIRLVREQMPPQEEILRQARNRGLPEADEFGAALKSYVARYERVPSEDLTIRVQSTPDDHVVNVEQFSSGGGASRQIKDGLRAIIQRHFLTVFEKQGLSCRAWKL